MPRLIWKMLPCAILVGSALGAIVPAQAQTAPPVATLPAGAGAQGTTVKLTQLPGESPLDINPDIEPGILVPGPRRR
ncbi:MAG: hypothetical protein WDN49_20245, partial [Acetobacteraceae bacterium]